MSKRTIWLFFSLISILLLFVAAGLVFIFLRFTDESHNYAESHFSYVVDSTENIINESGGALSSSDYMMLRKIFQKTPQLMALQLFSPTEGTRYLAAREKTLITDFPADDQEPKKARLSSEDSSLVRYRHPLSTPASPLYLEALYKRTLPAARINQLFVLLVIASASFILLMGLQFITPQTQASPREVSTEEGVNRKSPDRPAEEAQQKSKASPGSAPTAQELLRKLPSTGGIPAPPDAEDEGTPCDPPQLYAPSGLVWERFLIDKLNQELNRAASFDHDLTLGLLVGPEELSRTHLARHLLRAFRYKDLLFEFKEKGAAVILPNMDLDTAASRFEEFEAELAREVSQGFRFKAGISSRNGRLLTGERLFKESESALKRSMADNGNATVLFRVDPKKFRQVISEKNF